MSIKKLNKFFDKYKYNYQSEKTVTLDGSVISLPARYPNLTASMIFLPISLRKAMEVIGSKRLKPISILGGKAVLGVTIFDYLEGPVGPYRELAFSIAVQFEPKFAIPVMPLKFDQIFKSVGFFTLLLVTNTEGGATHSQQVYGYPTYSNLVDISIRQKDSSISINVEEERHKILDINIKTKAKFKTEVKRYKTFFKKDNKIILVNMDTVSKKAVLGSKSAIVSFGNHKILDLLNELSAEEKILDCICYNKAYEVLHVPLDCGEV